MTLLERAQTLADEVLFPSALETDRAGLVPANHLAEFADAGFHAVTSADRVGGAASPGEVHQLLETLASGCLTTTFVWAQHLGAVRAVSTAAGPVRDEWSARLTSGAAQAGVAFAHMLRPGPPGTVAERSSDGWLISGSAPWVTGWGHIDVVHVAARHGDDIVWGLIDAAESSTVSATVLDLAAVVSSRTAVLELDRHLLSDDLVTLVMPFEEWRAGYRLGLRANGSLPLGVAARCVRLLDDGMFDEELASVRGDLDDTDPADETAMSRGRAAAASLAYRAAGALLASTGGRGITIEQHAQRLVREAAFLLVQGQTPAIRRDLLTRLGSG